MKRVLTAMVAAGMMAGPALAKSDKQVAKLAALTPDDVARSITIKDDVLEAAATFTTINAFQEKRGLLRVVNYDNFIRGFVDKRTGLARYQIYQIINYGGQWRFYENVNYEIPGALHTARLDTIERQVTGCYEYLGCMFVEHVAFDVPESLLRAIAGTYQAGQLKAWRYRLKSKAGADWTDGITAAEVAGLLKVMDAYRSTLGAVSARPPEAPVPATAAPMTTAISASTATNETSLPPGARQLGGGVTLMPAKTASGFCIAAPEGYAGAGTKSRPAVTTAMPRCDSLADREAL